MTVDQTLHPTPGSAVVLSARLPRAERAGRTRALLARADATRDPDSRRELLDAVVVLNCRVADAIASGYRDRGVPLEDLRQAAYEGLVKAVRRYDVTQAEDLLTFAVPTIRGEVKRHFRDRSWMVRPPRRVQDLQARTNVASADLREVLGRDPRTGELCDHLGIDADEYAEVRAAFGCFSPVSLDRPVGDGAAATTLGDLIADDREEHEAVEARCMIAAAVRGLAERDRHLLRMRFYEDRTQVEMGRELGLAQTQVSRLLERVLRDLRAAVDPDARAHPYRRAGGPRPTTADETRSRR